MPQFSMRSESTLSTCHEDLQRLFREVVKCRDCQVLYEGGHRNKDVQDRLVSEGKSQTPYPSSKHNHYPSHAVDVAPYHKTMPHVDWNDEYAFYYFAGYVQRVADELGIRIRFGGDWDQDYEADDQSFFDLVHFELVLEE
jgi:hypothetical protein